MNQMILEMKVVRYEKKPTQGRYTFWHQGYFSIQMITSKRRLELFTNWICTSVLTVLERHRGAGKIQ